MAERLAFMERVRGSRVTISATVLVGLLTYVGDRAMDVVSAVNSNSARLMQFRVRLQECEDLHAEDALLMDSVQGQVRALRAQMRQLRTHR